MAELPPTDGPVVVQWPVTRIRVASESTGRPSEIAVPQDMTDAELLELIQWMASPEGLRTNLMRRSNIIRPPQFGGPEM